jgi:hypothetical protein
MTVPVVRELLQYAVYDREPLMNQRTHLFSRPLGMMDCAGILKSYTRTNLYQSGMLEAPFRFMIDSVQAVLFFGDDIPRLTHHFWWKTTASLFIGRKLYWQSPLAFCASPLLLANLDAPLNREERQALATHFLPRLTLPDGDAPTIREQELFEVEIEVEDANAIPEKASVEIALLGRMFRAYF